MESGVKTLFLKGEHYGPMNTRAVGRKSTKKFEVMGSTRKWQLQLPLPLVVLRRSCSRKWNTVVLAGLKIIRAVIEDEVMRQVGPRHRPNAASSCLRWGQQSGYVVFAGRKWPSSDRGADASKAKRDSKQMAMRGGCNDGRRQRTVREGSSRG